MYPINIVHTVDVPLFIFLLCNSSQGYLCYYFVDSEIKERIKKTKDEKKTKKVEITKSQKVAGKGNAPKPGSGGPKIGGGGGKR
jgi:hypothetical protein